MLKYTNTLALTKKLISIPSYVSGSQDETQLTDFLEQFLKAVLPEMTVEKQYIEGSKRHNLILKGNGEPKLFALGHIDTVNPSDGWQTDPLVPSIEQGKLYGLGASDMKGSLAAFLCALIEEKDSISTDNLLVLMYVDEEYDFKGIKKFVESMDVSRTTPDITLSLDGELDVASGCRGLIEINLAVRGVSGHSSNPARGINAITESIEALADLDRELSQFVDADLGPTTMNVSYIQGGVVQKSAGDEIRWLREGNNIPDSADLTVEVRPSQSRVNAQFVIEQIERFMKKRGLEVVEIAVRHDIEPWQVVFDRVSTKTLARAYATANVPFKKADRSFQGYIDAQMVAEKILAPTFIIGTGGANKHGANEYVSLQNLDDATRLYRALLLEVLS